MPPTKVYLIGERHTDLEKCERYRRAFHRLQPDTISFELSDKLLSDMMRWNLSLEGIPYARQRTARELFLAGAYEEAKEYFSLAGKEERLSLSDPLVEKAQQSAREIQLSSTWKRFWDETTTADLIELAALGPYLTKYFYQNPNGPYYEALSRALLDLLRTGSDEEISAANRFLDANYLFKEDTELKARLDRDLLMDDRDAAMAVKIVSLEGIVVHGSGREHVFGEYTLYDRLKEIGIPVERHLLLDFAFDDVKRSQKYQAEVRKRCRYFENVFCLLKK